MKKSINKNEKYDLIIITPKLFKKNLTKLASHKNQHNIKTKIITLKEIYSNLYFKSQGRDKPEKIKYFIKNAYDNWKIKYVMLIGGYKKLPVRYIYNSDYYKKRDLYEPKFISDLYYADIYNLKGEFSTWDTKKNGKFGEWKGKIATDKFIDLKPDIHIGRLPCNNRFEVNKMIKKIINYETNTYDQKWFYNAIGIGGNTYPENNELFEGENEIINAFDYLKDFKIKKFFASDKSIINPGISGLIKEINKGCGFLVFAGHGSPIVWNTFISKDSNENVVFSKYHTYLLKNINRLPICITNGCNNSQFDTSPLNIFKNGKNFLKKNDFCISCWSWSLTKRKKTGSIATIGSTALTYKKTDIKTGGKTDTWSFILPRFFYEYKINKIDILGKIWSNIIIEYLKKFPINWDTQSIDYDDYSPVPDAINAKTIQSFILFGDPTLKIGGYFK